MSQEIEQLVDRLVGLAGDEAHDECYGRPLELVLDLWAREPDVARDVILASIESWKDFPLIADDVETAADHVQDEEYLDLLDQCTRSRKIAPCIKIRILATLIRKRFASAIARYENNFRKLVSAIRLGSAEGDYMQICWMVREVCMFRLTTLLPALEELRQLCLERKFYYVFETKAQIDAAILWFREGSGPVLALARSPDSRYELRAACIFCLGCEQKDDLYSDLVNIYWEVTLAAQRSLMTRLLGLIPRIEMQIACVEAIVYSASSAHVLEFLTRAIEHSTPSSLSKKRYHAHVHLLLEAVYYAPAIDNRLSEVVGRRLGAKSKEIASRAWIALDHHGVDVRALMMSRPQLKVASSS